MEYLLLIILPYLASFMTNLFSKNNLSVYDKIKPVWQPPGFIFGIVWFILYFMSHILDLLLKIIPYGPAVRREGEEKHICDICDIRHLRCVRFIATFAPFANYIWGQAPWHT